MADPAPAIRPIDLFDAHQCATLLALQRASYQVEADLIAFADLPPLKDTATSLRQSGETCWGYYIADDLAGAISYKIIDTTFDIHRMMVHPRLFRRGIALALLHFVHKQALSAGAKHLIVSTGSANLPACRLYRRYGFHDTSTEEIVPGLNITRFGLPL